MGTFHKLTESEPAMRHLVLIFMIVFLPIRGWMGDAMATSMATTQAYQQTAAKAATDGLHKVADVTQHREADRTEHAAVAESDCSGTAAAEQAHAADGHCDSCSACQACHTVALTQVEVHAPAAFSPATPTRAATAQFASAPSALSQKPPIS